MLTFVCCECQIPCFCVAALPSALLSGNTMLLVCSERDFLLQLTAGAGGCSIDMAVKALNLTTAMVKFSLPRTSQDDNWHCAAKLCSADSSATSRLTVDIPYSDI